MKSFVLSIPKSPSKIDNYHFCECGYKFVNQEKCPKCGNHKFFSYKDVKDYNPKLFEIEKIKDNMIEMFIEYPVFENENINIKRKRVAVLINNEVKLNQEIRENFYLNYDLIAEIVKKYLKYLGLWEKRKKYFYLLKSLEDIRLLHLTFAKDPEVLLWNHWTTKESKEELFNKLLKNSPKSIKKAVYEKYKKKVFKLAYEPLLDYIIINSLEDVNLQRELLNYIEDKSIFITDSNVDDFIKFLKQFDKKQIFRFLKKNIELINFYIKKVNKSQIKEIKSNDIEQILYLSDIKNISYEYDINESYQYQNFTFKLPKDSYELATWGDKLSNCLAAYTNLHNKRYLIFGVFRKNRLIYAVNFDRDNNIIVEAKGFANSKVADNDMKIINEFFDKIF